VANVGDTLDNGNVRLTFRRTTAESSGEVVEVEAIYRPASTARPRHFHPNQVERFTIVDGVLRFEVDGTTRDYKTGESVIVPAGAVHAAFNPLPTPTRVIWETRPALQTERLFETINGLLRNKRIGPNGRPDLLRAAIFATQFKDTFVIAKPPPIVQSCVFGILAPIATVLGVKAEMSRY
jgi:quercetin dioxygenase-like cupin family protein